MTGSRISDIYFSTEAIVKHYTKEVEQCFKDYNIKFRVVKLLEACPTHWTTGCKHEHGKKYRAIFTIDNYDNMSFEFWQSRSYMENNMPPDIITLAYLLVANKNNYRDLVNYLQAYGFTNTEHNQKRFGMARRFTQVLRDNIGDEVLGYLNNILNGRGYNVKTIEETVGDNDEL